MPSKRKLGRLESDFGEVLESFESTRDLGDLEAYRDDPVGFVRDVLEGDPWSAQTQVMEALRHHDRVAWRGANALGKDWTCAAVACWWAYAVRGLVLISGPTARQVQEILMRKEIARAIRRAGLPGDRFSTAVRIEGDEADILAATSTESGKLTGQHGRRVLAILSEAQDVEPFGWEGLQACATGDEDRHLVVGNPLRPSGRFYEVSRPGSGWHSIQTSAFDHPNLDPDTDRYIHGGPSEAWVQRMRDDYGEGSPIWTARVEGEFPAEAVHGLFRRRWLEAAAERWEDGDLDAHAEDQEPVAALDPAWQGLDASVLAVRRGPVVDGFVVWEGRRDTIDLVEKVTAALVEHGITPKPDSDPDLGQHVPAHLRERAYGRVVVDEVGVGAGTLDLLRERGFRVRGYNGGKTADDSERFFNRRAESYWTLQEKLERGEIAVPADEKLVEELTSLEYQITTGGKVQLEAKADLKARLGRSPDRADALAMLVHPQPKKTAGTWGTGRRIGRGHRRRIGRRQ